FVGTHSEADFTPIIGDLVQVWALGRMSASALKTRAWAHALTYREIPQTNFGAHALEEPWYRNALGLKRRGYFYLVDTERWQRVVVRLSGPPGLGRRPMPIFPPVEPRLGSAQAGGTGAAIAAAHKAWPPVPADRNTMTAVPAGTPPVTASAAGQSEEPS